MQKKRISVKDHKDLSKKRQFLFRQLFRQLFKAVGKLYTFSLQKYHEKYYLIFTRESKKACYHKEKT